MYRPTSSTPRTRGRRAHLRYKLWLTNRRVIEFFYPSRKRRS